MISDEKRAEFAQLFEESARSYAGTEEGQQHAALYEEGREQAILPQNSRQLYSSALGSRRLETPCWPYVPWFRYLTIRTSSGHGSSGRTPEEGVPNSGGEKEVR